MCEFKTCTLCGGSLARCTEHTADARDATLLPRIKAWTASRACYLDCVLSPSIGLDKIKDRSLKRQRRRNTFAFARPRRILLHGRDGTLNRGAIRSSFEVHKRLSENLKPARSLDYAQNILCSCHQTAIDHSGCISIIGGQ